MDELLKNEQYGDLYAYYGVLLTSGQKSYFEDYYYNDLSLGEIALNHSVSRQAVYDNLQRSSKLLQNYEAKLHLQKDYSEIEKGLVDIAAEISQGDCQAAGKNVNKLLNKLRGE